MLEVGSEQLKREGKDLASALLSEREQRKQANRTWAAQLAAAQAEAAVLRGQCKGLVRKVQQSEDSRCQEVSGRDADQQELAEQLETLQVVPSRQCDQR